MGKDKLEKKGRGILVFCILLLLSIFSNGVVAFSSLSDGSFDTDATVESSPSGGALTCISNGSFDTEVIAENPPVSGNLSSISSGSFDTTVTIPGAMVINASGSFDTTIYIEYLVYSDWSPWWVMDYVSDISVSNFHASRWNDTCINCLLYTSDAADE